MSFDKKVKRGLLVGAAAGAAVGYFYWAPYLGFTDVLPRVIAAIPAVQVGMSIGLLEGAAKGVALGDRGELAAILAFPAALMLGAQYGGVYLARNAQLGDVVSSLAGVIVADVVANSSGKISTMPGKA